MQIETLDTGLLKGHSYVDPGQGWNLDDVKVTAVTDDGKKWGVIDIPEQSSAKSTTFFEVQIGELPRGKQVTVTTTAFFSNGTSITAQHAVEDKWPP